MLSERLPSSCSGELVRGRRLQGVVLGVGQAGGGKSCLAEGVNPTGSTAATKPKEVSLACVSLQSCSPLVQRCHLQGDTGTFPPCPSTCIFFLETFQTKAFFQKRVRGAARMLFPLSAMLLEDFGSSNLGSFLSAPSFSWRPPTVMGRVTRRPSLREGE